MLTDPIADMLNRIRNALKAGHEKVDVGASNLKFEIAKILEEEGFIKKYKLLRDRKQGVIRITLKYDEEGQPVIAGLKRVSTPGRRYYVSKDNIPKVLNGLGIAILTTSKGIMTDKRCSADGVGGEVICEIW
ncbi:MAG: 30S ribosomal protein S8 [Candidatus Schekmanbacteria bacterium RBG_16_38_11]|uniref:Small ribosomal subunit protein uS8 n=1 Tax=Candidatus Schekmanbacteria bacterium RBG_16_38_11 TaxID=1817880 RepID=A0A1F7RRK4_9BACT|nr:ribosomal protein S8 [uncultured bacterium]OGL44173.1 MAG: 30S ribosomal protein S8 [Candidatus Schekmanbacteria bacterium RBG_16_38_11]